MKPDVCVCVWGGSYRFLCVCVYISAYNSMKPLVSLISTVIKSESVFTEED